MKIGLCAIAKLENLYIKEWVEHYKKIGIDHIFLYDNNDIDGERFEDVINDYIDSGFVEIINQRGVCSEGEITFQTKCYTDCYQTRCSEFDWVCFFDVDEFLEFEKCQNIKDFISQEKFLRYDTIKICWKNYTDNDLVTVTDGNYNLQKRFTQILDEESIRNTEYKSIVKCNQPKIKKVTAHLPFSCNACNVLGERNESKSCFLGKRIWEDAYLKHYRTKTISEFLAQKVRRGIEGNGKNAISNSLELFFEYNNKTTEKMDYIKNFS